MKSSRNKFRNYLLNQGLALGRYTIVEPVASGGFGAVYKAIRDDGQWVAIKEFLPEVIRCRPHRGTNRVYVTGAKSGESFRQGLSAFFSEADILSRLSLSGVVPIWDVFSALGTAYLVMPFEPGCTLREWSFHAFPRPTPRAIMSILLVAARTLVALHKAGLIHCDIKPANIWIRPDRTVLLLDLGASHWADESHEVRHLVRTPGYAPPEQYELNPSLVPTMDVYAMGATLAACLLGQPPIKLERLRRDSGLTCRELLAGQFSDHVLRLLDRSLEIVPSRRIQSMEEFVSSLSEALNWSSPRHVDLGGFALA